MTIWINEQIDPCGILYSCIATSDPEAARACYENWQTNLTPAQREEGWTSTLREVESWDEVPVNALKLN